MLMPINSPLRFNSARRSTAVNGSICLDKVFQTFKFNPLRPNAETMPEVAVCPRPNGLPTATAKSPTRNLSESAIAICVNLLGF